MPSQLMGDLREEAGGGVFDLMSVTLPSPGSPTGDRSELDGDANLLAELILDPVSSRPLQVGGIRHYRESA